MVDVGLTFISSLSHPHVIRVIVEQARRGRIKAQLDICALGNAPQRLAERRPLCVVVNELGTDGAGSIPTDEAAAPPDHEQREDTGSKTLLDSHDQVCIRVNSFINSFEPSFRSRQDTVGNGVPIGMDDTVFECDRYELVIPLAGLVVDGKVLGVAIECGVGFFPPRVEIYWVQDCRGIYWVQDCRGMRRV